MLTILESINPQKLPEAWADRLVVAAKLSHGTSLWLGEVPEQRFWPSLTQLLGMVGLALCHPFTESLSGLAPWTDGPWSDSSAQIVHRLPWTLPRALWEHLNGTALAGRAYVLQQWGIANTCFSYARNLWLVLNAILPGFLPRNIPGLHNLPVAGREKGEEGF